MNRIDKVKVALVCIAALLFGSAVYLWVHREAIVPAIEAGHTDEIVAEMRDTLATVTARIEERDSKVRTEVRYVYEQTRARVNALPDDDVVRQLNDELAIFRGMDPGAGKLDGD
jgi:transposase